MVEVLFGESEGGAMKVAKEHIKNEQVLNKSEVVCIPFLLDIGDIKEAVESEYRKNLIMELYTANGRVDKSIAIELEKVWSNYLGEIDRLKKYALQGETFRLWYSNAPYSTCGLFYTCNLLKEYHCKVSVIKLPEYKQSFDDKILFLTNWGEVEPEEYYKYLSFEKDLTESEISEYSLLWNELKEDNSPLRANINGTLVGVLEDFYDHIIRKEMPDKEIKMIRLIGNILGKYPFGVGDWWYAKRINKLIELGELTVLDQEKETYFQIIKRV